MRIEVLYFQGCPNHEPAFETVLSAVKELAVEATIERVEVGTEAEAVAKRFLGSPSVRIDGRDIEAQDDPDLPYSLRCRRYQTGDGFSGCPPTDMVKQAIRLAVQGHA